MTTINTKMTAGAKLRLASLPRTRCAKCNSIKSYTNPMARCFECKKRFCYDDIWGGLLKQGMGKNEELRKACEKCKEKYEYENLT